VEADFLGSAEYFQMHGGSIAGFLAALYQDGLGRDIDASGQAYFTQFLLEGGSREGVALQVLSSDEGLQHTVQGLYQEFLGRSADPAGLAYWVDVLKNGGREELVIAALLGSDEFSASGG
jgi:hypothetical protein